MLVDIEDARPLSAGVCRRRFDRGELRLDGSDLVPLHFLWFRTSEVVAHMLSNLGADEVIANANQHTEPGEPMLRLRCAEEVYEMLRRGPFVRFDKVDRLFTEYGLCLSTLGEPLFGTQAGVEPRRVAVAA